ncbi:AAA family ATPase [Geodermatophilus sp. SYSU D01105]
MSMSVVPPPGRLRDLVGAQTVDEVLRENQGRARFIVDGLVHATTTLVYGLSEAGKSWLMVDLVAALARGENWLGKPINGGPRRSLVLAADAGGKWEYAERLGNGLGDGVHLGSPPPPDIKTWKAVGADAASEGMDIVVVDNLYAWAGDVDMNSNADVAGPLACLKTLAEAGVAVTLVHHTNSGGRKPAGVHSIPAFFRHSLAVTPAGIRSHGNDAPGATYWLARHGGRILDGGLKSNTRVPPRGGHRRVGRRSTHRFGSTPGGPGGSAAGAPRPRPAGPRQAPEGQHGQRRHRRRGRRDPQGAEGEGAVAAHAGRPLAALSWVRDG